MAQEIQALVNMVTAGVAAVTISYGMLKEYKTLRVWHFALYGLGLGLSAWVGLSYYAVLFINPDFNISLLRPAQAGWAIFASCVVISRLVVVETSADVSTVQELLTGRKECEQKIQALEEKVKELEQRFILYRDLSTLKSEKIEALEQKIEELRAAESVKQQR